jgi:hypothetical protein
MPPSVKESLQIFIALPLPPDVLTAPRPGFQREIRPDQLQPESDRTVVRQRSPACRRRIGRSRLCHGARAPGARNGRTGAARLRAGGRRERGPGAGAGIGRQRELRHQQQAAFDVGHAAVHLAGLVGKHAVAEQLGSKASASRSVSPFSAQTSTIRPARWRRRRAVDHDAGLADALQQADHAVSVTRANLRLPTCSTKLPASTCRPCRSPPRRRCARRPGRPCAWLPRSRRTGRPGLQQLRHAQRRAGDGHFRHVVRDAALGAVDEVGQRILGRLAEWKRVTISWASATLASRGLAPPSTAAARRPCRQRAEGQQLEVRHIITSEMLISLANMVLAASVMPM